MDFAEEMKKVRALVEKGNYETAEAEFEVAVAEESRRVFGHGKIIPYSKLQPFADAVKNTGLWGHIKGVKPETDTLRYVQELFIIDIL